MLRNQSIAALAVAAALFPAVLLRAQPPSLAATIVGDTIEHQDLGKLAIDLVNAFKNATSFIAGWVGSGACAINKSDLQGIQSGMNLLALHKVNLARTADRYLVNDPTVSWAQFKNAINNVTRETLNLYNLMNSQWAAGFFSGSALGPSYRDFMFGLADGKQGLLRRMQIAGNQVDALISQGSSVQIGLASGQGNSVQQAKSDVKRETDALRTEAIGLGKAADTLGDVVSGITCQHP